VWRIGLSIGLIFGAVAFCSLSVIIIFLIVPAVWEALFGPRGAAFGALGALALMMWGATKIMVVADRLSGMVEARRVDAAMAAAVAAKNEAPADWQAYNAAIARNKRWAFYRRTRQYDRLRELDLEMRAEQAEQAGRAQRERQGQQGQQAQQARG
jgi:hypothetical protein